jgi:hypothetical protein
MTIDEASDTFYKEWKKAARNSRPCSPASFTVEALLSQTRPDRHSSRSRRANQERTERIRRLIQRKKQTPQSVQDYQGLFSDAGLLSRLEHLTASVRIINYFLVWTICYRTLYKALITWSQFHLHISLHSVTWFTSLTYLILWSLFRSHWYFLYSW